MKKITFSSYVEPEDKYLIRNLGIYEKQHLKRQETIQKNQENIHRDDPKNGNIDHGNVNNMKRTDLTEEEPIIERKKINQLSYENLCRGNVSPQVATSK